MQLSVTYLVLNLLAWTPLLLMLLLLTLLPFILLIVMRLADGFMEPVYGTAENPIFNIAAGFALIVISAHSGIIDWWWSRLLTLSEISDEHMADFMEQSMRGHEQEISEKLLAILVVCLRHLINHLTYGQLAGTTLVISCTVYFTYLCI